MIFKQESQAHVQAVQRNSSASDYESGSCSCETYLSHMIFLIFLISGVLEVANLVFELPYSFLPKML
jgi:hypothetical protein